MIEINMNTARFKLTVKGHATAEESEQYKEICASASALAQSLLYSISKFNTDEKQALKSLEYRRDFGDMMVRAWPEEWAEHSIRKRFQIYGDGLELLAKSHPVSVHMIWDGEEIIPEEGSENE